MNKRRIWQCISHDFLHWSHPMIAFQPDEEDNVLLYIGRQGAGGGIFSLDGQHIDGPRWAAINAAAKAEGITVKVHKLAATDNFFKSITTFPDGQP